MRIILLAAGVLAGTALTSEAYIDASPRLPGVIKDATNIVVLQVQKVSVEKRAIVYSVIEDLKGKSSGKQVKHQLTEGWHPAEAKIILDWAAPGKTALAFDDGKASFTCIDGYWYQCSRDQDEWWRMTCGVARLAYTTHPGRASIGTSSRRC